MKQILQSLKTGATEVAEVPCPAPSRGEVLIRTTRTLVSAGTERMLVDFGKAGLIGKARQQPDKLRQVLDKTRTDGLVPTLQAVRNKLDQPLALGYCNVGTVIGTGPDVTGFAPGERVASNGKHAQIVSVPVNLCAKVPSGVSDEQAAFTAIGSIALQGMRLAQPTLGEAVVVIGLGLVGLMTVQLLRAHGCRVLGIDVDAGRLALAQSFGASVVNVGAGEDPITAARAFSRQRGVDAVIVAAATASSDPIHQAAQMCRKRGRIVLVGVTGLHLSRADFYEKELMFQVSCSYGPGRYDPSYELKGQDYPIGFVRWTEQRNFEAVLDMLAGGQLDVEPLISHRLPIAQAETAYAILEGSAPSLGILLEYPAPEVEANDALLSHTVRIAAWSAPSAGRVKVACIGAGSYAGALLIPTFKATGAQLRSIASSGGVSGLHAARKFGFEETTTDTERIFADPDVDAVVIATRHDTHARYTLEAIAAGKHVFVEKPLCLTLDELAAIERAYWERSEAGEARVLMVGFNRRFAPHVQKAKTLLAGLSAPKSFIMTVNAGAVPADHWTQDRAVGGGRIVGEACHFIDLLRYLAGTSIVAWDRLGLTSAAGDTVTLQLGFADGSIGTIHYFANGSRRFPKERIEIFCAGRVLQLDNFRTLRAFGPTGLRRTSLWRQDKGQHACAAAFIAAVREGGPSPIPFDEIHEVSQTSIELARL